MAGRRKTAIRAPGRIVADSSPISRAVELEERSSPALAHIEALIEGGGQIMIGTLAPIHGAAVAHDGRQTLAMLRRRSGESMQQLLLRLDAAIATARSTGSRVDEINAPNSGVRY